MTNPNSVRGVLLAALVVVIVVVSLLGQEQSRQKPLAFEVASIKTNESRVERGTYRASGSTLTATNQQLRSILAVAYKIDTTVARFKLVGGPEQLLSTRYDVRAMLPAGTSPLDIPEMLRNLLRERFTLRIHTETRQQPTYALSVVHKDRLGPQLRRSDLDCDVLFKSGGRATDRDTPRDAKNRPMCFGDYDFNLTAFGMHRASTLDRFIPFIQGFVDRPIVNATGLSGTFEWELAFDTTGSSTEAPTIFTAIQEQLGLKLESTKGPVEVFVIDHVERPTPD